MITKEMNLNEILQENPQAGSILMGFGIGIGGNVSNYEERLEDIAVKRNLDMDSLLASLNVRKFY